MISIRTFVFLFFLVSLPSLYAQSELILKIVDLKSNKGSVIIDLLDKNEKTYIAKTCQITDNTCTAIFKDLKHDQYAIRFIHDENGNVEFDINKSGIPKEGFGFSNNAFGRFGPKDFSEWLFTFSGDLELELSTRYL